MSLHGRYRRLKAYLIKCLKHRSLSIMVKILENLLQGSECWKDETVGERGVGAGVWQTLTYRKWCEQGKNGDRTVFKEVHSIKVRKSFSWQQGERCFPIKVKEKNRNRHPGALFPPPPSPPPQHPPHTICLTTSSTFWKLVTGSYMKRWQYLLSPYSLLLFTGRFSQYVWEV